MTKKTKGTGMKSRTINTYDPDWIKAVAKAKSSGIKISMVIRRLIKMWLDGDVEIKF